ncbi:hypothetical protein GGI21_005716, partial [Coemansia aciculifera]
MSLRKYASTESDDSVPAQPRSLASRLLNFGFGHSDHSYSGHSSEHGSGHDESDDGRHQKDDATPDSSSQSEDLQTAATTSKYLLSPSAMAVSTAHHHMDDAAGTHSASSDVSPASEEDTARATHEAMNTPITIPHSNTAPAATHGHSRPPVQLLGRNEDSPKIMTAAIAGE